MTENQTVNSGTEAAVKQDFSKKGKEEKKKLEGSPGTNSPV